MPKAYIPERTRWHPRIWWSRFKFRWPFAVWLLAVACAALLYTHGGEFGGMAGVVEAARELVAPLEAARLQALEVQIGQAVRAGDVVARMDTSLLDSEMAVEAMQTERMFAEATARIEMNLRDARIRQAETTGELEVLEAEVARLDDLLAKRLIDAQTVARLRARQGALARAAELYPEMIRGLEEELALMRVRQKTMHGWLSGAAETDVPALAEAAAERLGFLQLRREAYVLRARSDGLVSEILHQPGDVVQAGDPIATLTLHQASQVVGFLPEAHAGDVVVGMTGYVVPATRHGGPFQARVAAMMPEILPLPGRLSAVPGRALRGRRVILIPEGLHDLLPGEAVTIQFNRPILAVLKDFLLGRRSEPPG